MQNVQNSVKLVTIVVIVPCYLVKIEQTFLLHFKSLSFGAKRYIFGNRPFSNTFQNPCNCGPIHIRIRWVSVWWVYVKIGPYGVLLCQVRSSYALGDSYLFIVWVPTNNIIFSNLRFFIIILQYFY